jgi:hypothetical protein
MPATGLAPTIKFRRHHKREIFINCIAKRRPLLFKTRSRHPSGYLQDQVEYKQIKYALLPDIRKINL